MSIRNSIEEKLKKAFDVKRLVVEDRSHLHAKHASNEKIKTIEKELKDDLLISQEDEQENIKVETHIHIIIESCDFKDLTILQKHQRIYEVLKNEIAMLHAISINVT